MKAVIMAGGEGTRLRPLTANQPKPMLPMANAPMAEHVVNLLRRHGFECLGKKLGKMGFQVGISMQITVKRNSSGYSRSLHQQVGG